MKKIEKYISLIMLLFAVGFNLWLYRLEPTAQVDPNDNLFQFALVYRTNQIWDFADKKCSGNILTFPICHFSYLADHWVPNWNEGYNLPFYYSHIPQIAIVGTWRMIHTVAPSYGLFTYYHLVIYLLLSLFPVSVYLALLVTGISPVTAGFGALLASQISTDGLYGLDPPSFLWRGYGLSSQLFAMVWLPLAIAYAWRYFKPSPLDSAKGATKFLRDASALRFAEFVRRDRSLWLAILFLILTTSGHIGIGIMAFLSLIPLALAEPFMVFVRREWNRSTWELVKINTVKLTIVSVVTIFFLSYWLIPAFLGDKFHNFSFWDPVWKFNSYGAKEVLSRLGNGDLFDFGRWPIYTALVIVGIFATLAGRRVFSETAMQDSTRLKATGNTVMPGGHEETNTPTQTTAFAFLFFFWLLLYFGRTTWGNLINLIPSMKEFHLSRFIVGLHLAGLFLAPIGLTWLIEKCVTFINFILSRFTIYDLRFTKLIRLFVYSIICLFILIPIYQQTIRYNQLNETLIKQANANYAKQSQDDNALVAALQNLEKVNPGRVFSGRGGGWGHDFKIAETNMTMYLGNFALPTVLWLPETWSPNGDTEQYFREDKAEDYDLFNIRYVATPPDLAKENIQPFWRLIKQNPSWNLYEVPTSGYFTAGVRPAIVAADKYSRTNVVRLWIQSDDPKNGLYPELSFDTKTYPVNVGLPNFKMLDEVTFQVPASPDASQGGPRNSIHNIFAEPPKYEADTSLVKNIKILSQTDDSDMIFSAKVSVPNGCNECLVILKQTYHPDWQVLVDGKNSMPIITFPFYIGIPVAAGTHTIVASYKPSTTKVALLIITALVFLGMCFYYFYRHKRQKDRV